MKQALYKFLTCYYIKAGTLVKLPRKNWKKQQTTKKGIPFDCTTKGL